jgi:ethanolamine permease
VGNRSVSRQLLTTFRKKGAMENAKNDNALLNSIVEEVLSESHIDPSLILPEEVDYIRSHVLKKPLRVGHIWAMGVGVVIAGMFFGWNLGLPLAGPFGMLIASLIVCGLYLTWVLGLSELSVAMPFAGGPMAYGRRAVGRQFGFFMGWSMFLESLFATIGTGLAAGGYISFLLNPDHPSRITKTVAALICALVFLVVQYVGVKEQASLTIWLTAAAIVALICFWFAAIPGVSMSRVITNPLLPHGWSGVLEAIPYALWWLVIIEAVALASEEAHEPHISIPRGMVFAQITLVVLVVLTWFFVSAVAPYTETGAVDYPLPLAFKAVWGSGWFLRIFSAVSLSGLIVSYSGMIYATSRQSFSLGRAGYLPKVLGWVHPTRRVPHISLIVWTIVVMLFIGFGYFYEQATAVAILVSTFAAVIWYVLAMICLFIMRHKEPGLSRPYRAPAFPWLPSFVALLAAFAAYLFVRVNVQVLLPTVALYAAAAIWYALWARRNALTTAPEDVAARIAEKLAKLQGETGSAPATVSASRGTILEHATGVILFIGLASLVWMIARASNLLPGAPSPREVIAITIVWIVLFIVVSYVGFLSTRRADHPEVRATSAAGSTD